MIINIEKLEYLLVVLFDGFVFYFIFCCFWLNGESQEGLDYCLNFYLEDIYVFYKDFDGIWIDFVCMEFCDLFQNEVIMVVSFDECRIYVYEDMCGYGDIFYLDFLINCFQGLEYFEVKGVNIDVWEMYCIVIFDGQQMYFVFDCKGGFGGCDIYCVVKLLNG